MNKYLDVKEKHVLVIGSQRPWVEVVLLEHNVGNVTTLDYAKLQSEHPKLRTITPSELAEKYLSGSLPKFDAVISFSSLEHSGLGR